jgi:hypothetical protein
MTQMLLFGSPANTTETTLLAAAPASAPEQVAENVAENVAAQLDCDSGMHHMGDLARLVLLRYELVAKRRAMMAAKNANRAR